MVCNQHKSSMHCSLYQSDGINLCCNCNVRSRFTFMTVEISVDCSCECSILVTILLSRSISTVLFQFDDGHLR